MNMKKEIQEKRNELISNFDEVELEIYIQKISRRYYIALLSKDEKEFNNTKRTLDEIIFMFQSRYKRIHNYVNYSFIKSSNEILSQALNIDFDLYNPSYRSLAHENGIKDLCMAFDSGKKKDISYDDYLNMKKLYELSSSDDSLNYEIKDLIESLHKSFISRGDDDFK